MNTLPATITAVASSEHLSILTVSVGADVFHLLLAEPSDTDKLTGRTVMLAFKETEIILSRSSAPTSANIHSAHLLRIEYGAVLSQITLAYFDTTIIALVPSLTFNTLGIVEGDDVYWMVQPSEISLLREYDGI